MAIHFAARARGSLGALARTLVSLAFVGQFALLDAVIRGARAYFETPRLLLGLVASLALTTSVAMIEARRLRVALAMLLGLVFALQGAFSELWHVPIDRQIAISALHNAADVKAVLASMPGRLAAVFAATMACEAALVWRPFFVPPALDEEPGRASTWRWKRVRMGIALTLGATLVVGPTLRNATPEMALFDALAHALATRAGDANTSASMPSSPSLEPIDSSRSRLPNVVFVLTESVRATDACAAPGDHGCEAMPELDALFPDRLPLREMRAVASYTAVSLSALATGRIQTGDRKAELGAPTVFQIVKSIREHGSERVPFVAYWSAQMAAVFERDDVPRVVDSFVSVETLLGRAIGDDDQVIDRGVDQLLARHAVSELPALPQPFFLFLQFSGTHAPYFVDGAPAHRRFQPSSRVVSWSTLNELHNAYRNAIATQDAAFGAIMRAVLTANADAPLVVVYTSDHGEAFGEHAAIHHGQNLYDEQIHVPGFVVSRNGGLSGTALENVRHRERELVTHLDLLPTVLDAYGAWHAFGARALEKTLAGRSLLASAEVEPPEPAIAMTNCTALFPCPLNTWGVLGRGRVLAAQVWDHDWRCMELGGDRALAGDDPECADLRRRSRQDFAFLPNGAPNR